ncbi:MAG: PAS domain-containing protein, partial [Thermodesulfobacteriota bacterium]
MNHENVYPNLIQKAPFGYAAHKLVLDENGAPADYIFVEVNPAFAAITGLNAEEVHNRRVTEVLPTITSGQFDWIAFYGAIALNGGEEVFEQYSHPLGRWYQVHAFSPQPLYFATTFVDITREKQANSERQILLDNIPTQIWYLTDARTYGAVNRAHAAFFGFSVEEMAYTDMQALFPAQVAETCQQSNLQVFTSGKPVHTEEWVPHASGAFRLLSITKSPHHDAQGTIRYVVCSAEDITEQREAEHQLDRQERLLAKMLAVIPDMVSVHDPDLNIIYSNWQGLAAVAPEHQHLHSKCYQTYWGLPAPCSNCMAQTVLETKQPLQKDVLLADGRWIELRAMPICNPAGTVEYFIEWVRDISERKQAEAELKHHKGLLEGVINGISDILAIQYPDHSIDRYNRAGYERLGLAPHEVQGRKCYELLGRDRECEPCATRQAVRQKSSVELEKYVPELGQYLNCRSHPVLDENGRVVRIVEHLRDITPQKHIEEELRRSRAELAEQEQLYRSLVEDHPHFVQRFLPDTTILFVNTTFAEYMGCTPATLQGQQWITYLPPEAQQQTLEYLAGFTPEDPTHTNENGFPGPDGTQRWTAWTNRAFFDAQGNVTYFQSVGVDITEKKHAEQALAESEARLRSMFEYMGSGVAIYEARDNGADFVFLDLNP